VGAVVRAIATVVAALLGRMDVVGLSGVSAAVLTVDERR